MTVLVKERARDIKRVARKHGVVRLRVFGSYATETTRPGSDLELLVSLKPQRDLWDLAEFKLDLEDLLGFDVDVVTEGSMSPYLKQRILRSARPLSHVVCR